MNGEFSDNLENADREIRINNLKNKARDLAGGDIMSGKLWDDVPPDIEEQFWENVVNIESAPWVTAAEKLAKQGVDLPPPEELDEPEVTAKLWELIQRLAKMRTFISSTNHLSDRELYQELWRESLREEQPDMPVNEFSAWHIDMLGGCSEEDIRLQMKYYADEEERQRWLKDWPDYDMPAHEDPPHDRDRFLPQATYRNPDES